MHTCVHKLISSANTHKSFGDFDEHGLIDIIYKTDFLPTSTRLMKSNLKMEREGTGLVCCAIFGSVASRRCPIAQFEVGAWDLTLVR